MLEGVANNNSYRIAGNFRGGFNLAIWRIFPRIAKFKSANIKILATRAVQCGISAMTI